MRLNCVLCNAGPDLKMLICVLRRKPEAVLAGCRNCGLLFTSGDYSVLEWNRAPNESDNLMKSLYKYADALDFADEYIKEMNAADRIADIGCGYGRLLKALEERTSAELIGLEPDGAAAQFAGRVSRAKIVVSSLSKFVETNKDKKFNLFVLRHVLEHLPDPLVKFEALRDLLGNGGMIYIEVPNVESINKNIISYFKPGHLFHYSPHTLNLVLSKAGLKIIKFALTDGARAIRVIAARMDDARPAVASAEFGIKPDLKKFRKKIQIIRFFETLLPPAHKVKNLPAKFVNKFL
ncbi:class I SAM-dependent methyltransferase [Candidatus Uhrbacteria bacterium]|nr:class I SAM-dependent methyltransferase [Candidatus Uhrbacteria bacterium]